MHPGKQSDNHHHSRRDLNNVYLFRHYNSAVDIWSVGAVLAELLSLNPLFPGNNDIDQLFLVFQIMGTPSLSTWPVRIAQVPLATSSLHFCFVHYIRR